MSMWGKHVHSLATYILFSAIAIHPLDSLRAEVQALQLPTLTGGDTWTYRSTTEKGSAGWNQTHDDITINRATSSTIYYSAKQSGSSQAPRELIAGSDWSRMRNVNGKETIVNKPLSFPLSAGKTWEVEYKEQQPNNLHKSEQWTHKYVAVGFETVEVPAGKFEALKIECEGKWTAELAPTQRVAQGAQVSQNNTTMVTQVQKTTDSSLAGPTKRSGTCRR
jgi:hypothetical protein